MTDLSGPVEHSDDKTLQQSSFDHTNAFVDRRDAGNYHIDEAERLQAAIGREIRSIRIRYGLSATELASAASISTSMLSKVEHGSISPSLDTLQALASALGVSPTALFRRYDDKCDAVFVEAGQGRSVERRGTRAGQHCDLLGHIGSDTAGVVLKPFLISLSQPLDELPVFDHDGLELLYVLEGEIIYRHDSNLYRMKPGDSLLFDASAPHGSCELIKTPVRLLSVISYRDAWKVPEGRRSTTSRRR